MTADLPDDDLPDVPPAKRIWLVTFADLALLLVGFFVFLQASQQLDRKALAQGIREGFGVHTPADEPIAVAAGAMTGFAPASAMLPAAPGPLAGWAREALRDPRVILQIAGTVDGTPADVDPASRSGAVLAADRARAVAVALIAAGLPADRLVLAGAGVSGHRAVSVTTAYAGLAPPPKG